MQGLFNMHKRARPVDDSEGRKAKHQKRDDNGIQTASGVQHKQYSEQMRQIKIDALAKALDDVLDKSDMDAVLGHMGEESFNRSLDLRTALRKLNTQTAVISAQRPSFSKNPIPVASLTPSSSSSQPQTTSHDIKNTPKLMSGLSLTPWKSSEIPTAPPPLPEILDKTLERATFIHAGNNIGKITELNYERLEWIGDVYIELTATLLISQTFPFKTPGQCAQLRERLVKNITLAEYARKYGFDKRATVPTVFMEGYNSRNSAKDGAQVKVLGDIFEAYVAAVVLSDSSYGLSKAVQWLKDLWSIDIAAEIINQEKSPLAKLKSPIWNLGMGMDPGAIDQPDPTYSRLNFKDQLSKALGSKGIKIEYKDAGSQGKDKNTKLPIFTVGVYLTGWDEKDKQIGIGRANGKKEAGLKAAEMALNNKKQMRLYMDKKKAREALQEQEAEALAKPGSS